MSPRAAWPEREPHGSPIDRSHPMSRPATPGQLRDLAIALGAFDIHKRDEAIAYCGSIVGRPIEGRRELTTRDASAVLDEFEAHACARLTMCQACSAKSHVTPIADGSCYPSAPDIRHVEAFG